MAAIKFAGVLRAPLFLWIFFAFALTLDAKGFEPILRNDGIMPPKEVAKLDQMGRELYDKTGVAVFVAAVSELNATRPIDLIEQIKARYPDYLLLYFSKKPTTVNIFATPATRQLADIEQILSPLPWRGTIKPVMSPAFSKDEGVKLEVAILNGYADLVDQVAASKGVVLKSSIGSGSKKSFLFVRWIFYVMLAVVILQFIRRKAKNHEAA
ncbi:MAG: hypothetical protein GXO33_01045 [Epsilonproteobacteria bacterium]|nr:hypothetical protein [Campylobacterota bacterium]